MSKYEVLAVVVTLTVIVMAGIIIAATSMSTPDRVCQEWLVVPKQWPF